MDGKERRGKKCGAPNNVEDCPSAFFPNRPARTTTVLGVLAIGLLLTVLPHSPVGLFIFASISLFDFDVLNCMPLMPLGAGLCTLALGRIVHRGGSLAQRMMLRAAYVLMVLCYVALSGSILVKFPIALVALIVFLLGVAAAPLLFGLIDAMRHTCFLAGRAYTLRVLVMGHALMLIMGSLFVVCFDSLGSRAVLGFACVLIVCLAACDEVLLSRACRDSHVSAGVSHPVHTKTHWLAPSLTALFAGFGVAYGAANALVVMSIADGVGVWIGAAILAAMCMGIYLFMKMRGITKGPSDNLARMVAVVAGVNLAAIALVRTTFPAALPSVCLCASALISTAAVLVVLKLASEVDKGLSNVIMIAYGVFVMAEGVSFMLVRFTFIHFLPDFAWESIALATMIATLLIVLCFPNKISKESIFRPTVMSRELEQENRARLACEKIADRHKLTNRERAVLTLVFEGKKRQEIADDLLISVWTVRDHLSNIYRKVGVHSAEELVALMDGDAWGQR